MSNLENVLFLQKNVNIFLYSILSFFRMRIKCNFVIGSDKKDMLSLTPMDHCYNEPCMGHGICISRKERYLL